MSTWMVTSRNRPILRIGIFSMACRLTPSARRASRRGVGPAQRDRERIRQRRFGGDLGQIHAEMHDGLRDLRADAADDAIRAHQSGGGHGLQECCATSVSTVGTPVMSMMAMRRAGAHDGLQQAFHHDLRARAVERADQRQREDAVPQLHDGRRQLEQLLLLARDHFFAALHDTSRSCRARACRARPSRSTALGERVGSPLELTAQPGEQRLLQRQDERRRLRWRETLMRARARQCQSGIRARRSNARRWTSKRPPMRGPGAAGVMNSRDCSRSSRSLHADRSAGGGGELQLHPFGEHFLLVGEHFVQWGGRAGHGISRVADSGSASARSGWARRVAEASPIPMSGTGPTPGRRTSSVRLMRAQLETARLWPAAAAPRRRCGRWPAQAESPSAPSRRR